MHVWIAMLVVVATFVMAWLLAAALRRRLRLAQLKNDLVATVSHELKTPLASIRLLVDTLLEAENHPTGEMPVAQVREYLEMIAHENARLTRLIDNFLTFSRMERGMQRFNFQVIDVREAVHQAASVFREHLGDVDSCLRVDAGEPAYVSADLDALVTAVVNLLENAWKYGSSPKSVGKKEMLLYFSNRSSGSTKGGRPFHLHHHIVLTGVKANADQHAVCRCPRRRKGLRGPSSKFQPILMIIRLSSSKMSRRR
jgi:signal transduction histidine kinase